MSIQEIVLNDWMIKPFETCKYFKFPNLCTPTTAKMPISGESIELA